MISVFFAHCYAVARVLYVVSRAFLSPWLLRVVARMFLPSF